MYESQHGRCFVVVVVVKGADKKKKSRASFCFYVLKMSGF